MATKFYTWQDISSKYGKLTRDKKIEVLSSAIDYMQQYNGRTKWTCIAMAMGYKNDSGANNEYYLDK